MTIGEHIAFSADAPLPGSLAGDALLAHEVAHTIQQSGHGDGLERRSTAVQHIGQSGEAEADAAAVAAVAGGKLTVRERMNPSLRLADCGERASGDRRQGVDPDLVDHVEMPEYQPFIGPTQLPLFARLESDDEQLRTAALTELVEMTDDDRRWNILLLVSDSPHEDVQQTTRRIINRQIATDRTFRQWLHAAAEDAGGLGGDLAMSALIRARQQSGPELANYRNVLLQRVAIVRQRLEQLDDLLYAHVTAQIGSELPRGDRSFPTLDQYDAELPTMSAEQLAQAGTALGELHQQVGAAAAHVEQLQTAIAELPAEHPLRTLAERQLGMVLTLSIGLSNDESGRAANMLAERLANWPARVLEVELETLIDSFTQGERVVEQATGFRGLPSFRTAYSSFRFAVLDTLLADLRTMTAQLRQAQEQIDRDPASVRSFLASAQPAIESLNDRLTYSMHAVASMLEYSEMALTGEAHADVLEPTMRDFKLLFAEFATLAHLRDTDPEAAATRFQELVESREYREAMETAQQWREIQEGELQFALFLGDVLTVIAAIYTAGAAAWGGRMLMGAARAATITGRIAIFATEVTVFHVSNRAIRSVTRGEEFYNEHFWGELGETALLFGVLKGAGAAYSRFINPRISSPIGRTAGQLTTTFVAFQGWSVGQHMWRNEGALPDMGRFLTMARDNALFLGALHLGLKASQPLVAPIQARALEFQRRRHNAEGEILRERIDSFLAERSPAEGEATAILRHARALYLERRAIFQALHRENPTELPEAQLREVEQYLTAQAESCTRAIELGRFRLRGHETDPNTFVYEGEPAVLQRRLESQGYETVEFDAATGRIEMRTADGRSVQLMRTRRGTSGSRDVSPLQMDAEAVRVYEELRTRSERQVRAEISAISRHSGVPQSVLSVVRQHLFIEMHDLPIGPLRVIRQRFDPFYDIAEIWGKAEQGPLTPTERAHFDALVAHEYVEARLMQMGMPYRSAHPEAFLEDISMPTVGQFGAHDVAPLAHPTADPFRHWESLGYPAGRLTIPEGRLVTGLDGVVTSIVEALRHHGRAYRIETNEAGETTITPLEPVAPTDTPPGGRSGSRGAETTPPGEPVLIDLFHGTSASDARLVQGGIRVDASSANPGRRQWGFGFYLSDLPTAESYAEQTGNTPAVVPFRRVDLASLGTILDLTTGEGAVQWAAYLDAPPAPGIPMTRRTLWQQNSESRGTFFESFLEAHELNPDVVIAPHGATGSQTVIRSPGAARRLQEYLE